MAHTISERRRQQRARELAGDAIRQQRRELTHARRLIALWNLRAKLGRRLTFYPTVGAAIAAQTPILECVCPGCQVVGEVDLRKVDRHPDASLSSLIPALSCKRCCPNPPFAKLIGLRRVP